MASDLAGTSLIQERHNRRGMLGLAASAAALGEFGFAEKAAAQAPGPGPVESRPARQEAFAIKQIRAGVLDVGYAEAGPASGPAVLLLHGWPYDIHAFADVVPMLAASGFRVIVPHIRGYGTTRFLSDETPRNGEPAALAVDILDLMDSLGIPTAVVAGFDWGARTANIMAACGRSAARRSSP